jgi:hypothetical protein
MNMTHHGSETSPKTLLLAPCLALAMLAAGCSTWKSPGSWFGGEKTDGAESMADSTTATAYYTGEADVKLYPEPRFSSSYIVALPLHQKVYRSKLDRGFAYVQVEGSGQTGWIDNSKLTWRLPKTVTSVPPAAAPEAPEEAPPVEVTAEPPPAPAEESILAPAAAEAQEAPPEKAQPDEPRGADPSLFSPF